MAAPTLAAAGLVHLATAAVFLAVGHRLAHRQVSDAERMASHAFVAWWWALAAYLAMQGALTLAAVTGHTSLDAYMATRYFAGPLLCFAAGSLAFHILYLFTGKRAWATPLTLYYAAAALAYDYSLQSHHATALTTDAWEIGITFQTPLEGPLWTTVLASIGLPMILGSLAYLTLTWRLRERGQRYRVTLVATSILLWVTTGLAAQIGGGPLLRFLTVVVVGLLAALTILLAYFPPAPIRRWLNPVGHSP